MAEVDHGCSDASRYRGHPQEDRHRGLRETERAKRSNDGWLNNDEVDADRTERHDEKPEQEDQPRHGAPAALIANRTGEGIENVGDCSEAGVRDWERLRYARGDDGFGAVAPAAAARKEWIPNAFDVTQLEGGEVARDEQPYEGQPDDGHALHVGGWRVGPAERYVGRRGQRLLADAGLGRHHDGEHDDEGADQSVDGVSGRVGRPEHERRKEKPRSEEHTSELQSR